MKFELILPVLLFSLSSLASAAGETDGIVDMGEAFLEQVEERDSVLIADHLRYGFELKEVQAGTQFGFPEYDKGICEGVEIVSPWRLDTVKVLKGRKKHPELMDIKGSIVLTAFDEGEYHLPPIYLLRVSPEGVSDTLRFTPKVMDVMTMPVDTTTFEMHDIKGQIQYPIQFKEVAPWLGASLLLVAIIVLAVWLTRRYFRRKRDEEASREPAHIVALRKLDAFRGEAFWAPEKQKHFYSGVTDALREYLVSRYGVAAMEMTTKEIFDDLKDKEIPEDLKQELQELFERADYVKFAKYFANREENASAVPFAVRFVTMTYQEELDREESGAAAPEQEKKEE